MNFSIIVPAFNEYEELEKNIPRLSRRFPDAEIIVVENGSNIAPKFDYLKNVREFVSFNRGLGVALKFGIAMAKNNTVIFLPADMSYDLSFVDESTKLINKGFDLVIGSKGLPESKVARPGLRKLISRFYNFYYNMTYGLRVKDITGVKAYNRDHIFDILFRCPDIGIGFEVQLIRQLRLMRRRIIEIPVRVYDHRTSRYQTI